MAAREFQVFWSALTSEEKQYEELGVWLDEPSALMQASHHLVILKRELLRKERLMKFKLIFLPVITYMVMSFYNKNCNSAVANAIV